MPDEYLVSLLQAHIAKLERMLSLYYLLLKEAESAETQDAEVTEPEVVPEGCPRDPPKERRA